MRTVLDSPSFAFQSVWDWWCDRWFYVFGLLLWSSIELIIYLAHDRQGFVDVTQQIQVWGIGLTIVYKACVLTIMMTTRPKTTLDRVWIWHTASLGLLFILAFVISVWPEWVGIARPGRPVEGFPVSNRLVVYTAIWFQVWGYINWSALAVLREAWNERGRFVRVGIFRMLRSDSEMV